MRRLIFISLMAVAVLAVAASAEQGSEFADLERFSGVYERSPQQYIYVHPWPGGGGKLAYSDGKGRIRALFYGANNVFTAGPGLLLPSPIEMKITFVQNSEGKVTRLIQQRNGCPERMAQKLEAYRREKVSFRDGEVNLTGALHLPAGKGPHPAMVLVPGSGRANRHNLLPIVHFLVRHGMALLGYDKRGVGESTGSWRAASLEDLAGDAVAAVQFLRTRTDIDPARIGMFGASQGGWVAPLAASQWKEVAFLISVSGPGMSPAELELQRLEHDLLARGFGETAVREALALVQLRDDVVRGRAGWENFQEAARQARETKWFPHVSVPPSREDSWWEHWRRLPLDYDPGPVIARLRVPALVLFGGLDRTVLPEQNADRWKRAFEKDGAKDYTVKILPTGNHMLLKARTGSAEEYPQLKQVVSEYAPLLLDWLRERNILAREPRETTEAEDPHSRRVAERVE